MVPGIAAHRPQGAYAPNRQLQKRHEQRTWTRRLGTNGLQYGNSVLYRRTLMIIVVMGVSGVGKTTVGQLLAEKIAASFYDADNFHSPENVAKMRSGTPLTDDDRWPWLDRLNTLLRDAERRGENAVLACSALKQKYRDRIARDIEKVDWIYLKGSFELIKSRLDARKGHYMSAKLLESQFAALESPASSIEVDVAEAPAELVSIILASLQTANPRIQT
jgi:gluconokinase